MQGWKDERQRRVALSLGKCLQRQWGWKTPYFIPGDRAMTIMGGPEFGVYAELDLADVHAEFEVQLGTTMPPGFWDKALRWEDENWCFGDLVRDVAAGLSTRLV